MDTEPDKGEAAESENCRRADRDRRDGAAGKFLVIFRRIGILAAGDFDAYCVFAGVAFTVSVAVRVSREIRLVATGAFIPMVFGVLFPFGAVAVTGGRDLFDLGVRAVMLAGEGLFALFRAGGRFGDCAIVPCVRADGHLAAYIGNAVIFACTRAACGDRVFARFLGVAVDCQGGLDRQLIAAEESADLTDYAADTAIAFEIRTDHADVFDGSAFAHVAKETDVVCVRAIKTADLLAVAVKFAVELVCIVANGVHSRTDSPFFAV